jgi:hypothetical protein
VTEVRIDFLVDRKQSWAFRSSRLLLDIRGGGSICGVSDLERPRPQPPPGTDAITADDDVGATDLVGALLLLLRRRRRRRSCRWLSQSRAHSRPFAATPTRGGASSIYRGELQLVGRQKKLPFIGARAYIMANG